MERARTDLLDAVFDDLWLMKDTDNPGATSLNVEDKRTFLERVSVVTKDLYLKQVGAAGKGAYVDITRLLAIETHQDGMAVVRVDRPTVRETIFLVLFRVDEAWRIVSERRGTERTE